MGGWTLCMGQTACKRGEGQYVSRGDGQYVRGGLVKNKMMGGSLYQTKPSRPPPLTCIFFIETPLFRQATFYLAELFRQATFYLAELFRQAMFYLAELSCQIPFSYFLLQNQTMIGK